ncbi:response regulator transcription factor [Clostridium sp.]|jgi:DNA-binding NarL/FixJ family response regulator|uniref:response regulator transcription factor n=1 Tax=Clostridium sp. TaxID=1506 RepID=UPI0025C6E66C|nr:response regulator transcription factor [Clostridium sp.]MCI9069751.1 response regulator transcription factor [Clostridium sp.]
MSIKVLICDDDSLIRESLKLLLPLKADIEIVGVAEDGEEAINICTKENVDVALLDIRMPKVSGVEAVKKIVSKSNTKCLILTTFDEEDYINEAIEYGAKGYILKSSTPEQIAQSITSVYNNTIVMNENVLNKFQGKSNQPQFSKYEFTEREKDIIIAISEGLSNKEISKKLFISEGTIRNYITIILDKTNLEHRTAIAVNYLKGNL